MRRLFPAVETAVLEGQEELEQTYAQQAPHLRLNFVTSLDAAFEVEGRSGPLGGPADRAAFLAMRSVADVILVGAGTARAEGYGPVRLPEGSSERRVAAGRPPLPAIALVTNGGRIEADSRLLAGQGRVLILTSGVGAAAASAVGERAEVIVCGDDQVDPAVAIAELARRGLTAVLCEGGPSLARSLFSAGLVDELCLTIAPLLVGTAPASLAPSLNRLILKSVLEGDGLLLTRYRVDRP